QAENIIFRARGNEPGWHADVADTGITFGVLGEEPFTIAPLPKAEEIPGALSYSAVVDGRPFSLKITNDMCVDTMIGMPYRRQVKARWGGRNFSGCGGEPADLLHGDWRIETVAGKPVLAGAQATLAFDTANGTSGFASCNRFKGRYQLTG